MGLRLAVELELKEAARELEEAVCTPFPEEAQFNAYEVHWDDESDKCTQIEKKNAHAVTTSDGCDELEADVVVDAPEPEAAPIAGVEVDTACTHIDPKEFEDTSDDVRWKFLGNYCQNYCKFSEVTADEMRSMIRNMAMTILRNKAQHVAHAKSKDGPATAEADEEGTRAMEEMDASQDEEKKVYMVSGAIKKALEGVTISDLAETVCNSFPRCLCPFLLQ